VAERRSNSLVIHARKPEMDLIFQLVAKLDVDIYGGQRVFIYFVENSKAKDLSATLDSIYGRSASTAARPAALPGGAPPPPIAPPAPSLPRIPGWGGEVGASITDLRFIADEVTNAIIVTTYPRLWKDIEETIKKLDRAARQVLIEVLVAEVTLNDDTKLGIEWAVRSGKFTFSNTQNTAGQTPIRRALASSRPARSWPPASTCSSSPASSLPPSMPWPAKTGSTCSRARPS
jgi:general secretion pathway protein D